MTLALYARHKEWPFEGATIELRHSRIYAADCSECETKGGMLDRIETSIALAGPLGDEQRARLLEIAEKCPVHRTLTSEIDIRSRLADGVAPAR
jgi:putative redox protein